MIRNPAARSLQYESSSFCIDDDASTTRGFVPLGRVVLSGCGGQKTCENQQRGGKFHKVYLAKDSIEVRSDKVTKESTVSQGVRSSTPQENSLPEIILLRSEVPVSIDVFGATELRDYKAHTSLEVSETAFPSAVGTQKNPSGRE